MKPVRTAVIGSGAISDIYLTNMTRTFSGLEVVCVSAAHLENARKKAEQYKIEACATEEVFARQDIELVVVLTPAPTHYELIRQALLSGKHVYTEKPLATTVAQARELLDLAAEKGLLLGCAPETFLGSSLQTARKALEEGMLGDVTSFHVVANRDITLLASVFRFLCMPYGGICYDYGVYYLTALVSLLGPMEKVTALVSNHAVERCNTYPESPDFGKTYIYDNESQAHALLTTRSGIPGTFSLNGDSVISDQAYFTIQGTKGILVLSDANGFGGDIRFIPNDPANPGSRILEPVSPLSFNSRGIGPADMARCIREGGLPLTDAHMAAHVLDIVEQMIASSQAHQERTISSTCSIPRFLDDLPSLMR